MAKKFSMVNTSGLFQAEAHLNAAERMQDAMSDLKQYHTIKDQREQHEQERNEKEKQENLKRLQQSQKIANEINQKKKSIYIQSNIQQEQEQDSDLDSEDEEFLNNCDQDPELEQLRKNRLEQLKAEHLHHQALQAKGHGEYREISQDEFLKEVTTSDQTIVHFYHRDFERCKILDKHLSQLAPRHLECKFLKLNAEKAPFFIEKLQVRVLPTVIGFIKGIAVNDRLIGFEGLFASDEEEEIVSFGSRGYQDRDMDMFPTIALARKLNEMGMIEMNDQDLEEEEG